MSEYIIFGLGRFGRSLAEQLQRLGNDVVAVDSNRDLVQEMADTLHAAYEADATSESTLRELGVANFDAAVVAIGQVENSILTTLLLKKIGVDVVIAKASSELHRDILGRVGADRVIFPEQETAVRLAHGIGVPEVVDYLSLSPDMGVSKISVPSGLVGKPFAEVSVDGRSELRLLAIIRKDRVIFGASVGEPLHAEDILLVAGHDSAVRGLSRLSRSS